MKKILFLVGFLFLVYSQLTFGQDGWIKEFPGPGMEISGNIINTSDGNYAFAITATEGFGSGLDAGTYLIKVDLLGNILWTHNFYSYLPAFSGFPATITETSDNGFLIHTKNSPGPGMADQPYFIKLDENGNEQLSSYYIWEFPNVSNLISDLILLSDGNFLIAGRDQNTVAGSSHIRKIDENLNSIWEITQPGSNNFSLNETATGEILACGRTGNVFKLDASGNQIWQTILQPTNGPNETFQSIHPLPNNEIAIFTVNFFPPFPSQEMFTLDNDGNLLNIRT